MLRKCQRHWEEQEKQRRNGQGAGHLPERAARLQQRLLVSGRKGKLQPHGHSWDSSIDGEGGNIVMGSDRFQEAQLFQHTSLSGLLWFPDSNQQARISRLRQCFQEAAVRQV